MKKNPFKKQAAMDTLVNVGIGGAANVAIDYALAQIDAVATADPTYVNVGKIAAGALVGSMVSSKTLRAACDGVAVVGVSNLVSGLVSSTTGKEGAAGLPAGTVAGCGRVRLGNRRFRRAGRVAGVNGGFMGC